ncbi:MULTISPECIES: ABC transporter permease [Dickeya]|uniref:ABC transporter permease n=1 Tax=Dickeya TaxID=204037 RepID=UPI001AED11D3|nr:MULTISPECIES: ABC transporter permease [Dickeya]MBP2834502.1 ABC transporter permease [Dickeya parazeae]UJR63073.1 ABC transporter permease [Dickeya zeae]
MNSRTSDLTRETTGRHDDSSGWKEHSNKTDLFEGIRAYHVWLIWGWHDIRQRYRRSILGPFWFTLTTLIMVGALGFLYSELLGQDISTYLPYLGVGMVVWQFISTAANEGCISLIGSSHIIKQVRMPLTVHVCRMAWRNFIILLHSLPVVIFFMFIFGHMITFEILLIIPGLLILLLNAIWSGIVFGLLCSRFRDVAPIIGNLFQVCFFITPVMWQTSALKERVWVANYNPFYHMIEIVRAPILGGAISITSWIYSIVLLILGFCFAQYLMIRCRDRVAYWL